MWTIKNSAVLNCIVSSNSANLLCLLGDSLSQQPRLAYHRELLHTSESLRRASHATYFGPSDKVVDWCGTEQRPEQYLNGRIFDNPKNDERVICVAALYPQLAAMDLWTYLGLKYRAGDFCNVNIWLNPLLSYLESFDFLAGAVWRLQVDLPSLLQHVRDCLQQQTRLHSACPDRLNLSAAELLLDYRRTSRRVLTFLNAEYGPQFPELNSKAVSYLNQLLEVSAAIRSSCSRFEAIPELRQLYLDLP